MDVKKFFLKISRRVVLRIESLYTGINEPREGRRECHGVVLSPSSSYGDPFDGAGDTTCAHSPGPLLLLSPIGEDNEHNVTG